LWRRRTAIAFLAVPIPLRPGRALVARDSIEVLVFFEEVRDVKKCVTLQPQIDECRLHSGEDARYAAFVYAAR
jgi:hypothetical protein